MPPPWLMPSTDFVTAVAFIPSPATPAAELGERAAPLWVKITPADIHCCQLVLHARGIIGASMGGALACDGLGFRVRVILGHSCCKCEVGTALPWVLPAFATQSVGLARLFSPSPLLAVCPCCHSSHKASPLSPSCCRLEEETALPWLWPAFATLSAGIALLMLAVGLPVLPWHRYGSEKLRSGSSMRSGGLTPETGV